MIDFCDLEQRFSIFFSQNLSNQEKFVIFIKLKSRKNDSSLFSNDTEINFNPP